MHVARGDVAAIGKMLPQVASALVAHLDLEDNQLYPELIRLAEEQKNQNGMDVARTFSTNMKHISASIRDFLKRYQGGVDDLESFRSDWQSVGRVLRTRVSAEERTLYKKFAQLSRRAA